MSFKEKKEFSRINSTDKKFESMSIIKCIIIFIFSSFISWNFILNEEFLRGILRIFLNKEMFEAKFDKNITLSSPLLTYKSNWIDEIKLNFYQNNSKIKRRAIESNTYDYKDFCNFTDYFESDKAHEKTRFNNSSPNDLILTDAIRLLTFKGLKTFLRSIRSTSCAANIVIFIDEKTKEIFKNQVKKYETLYQVNFINIGIIDDDFTLTYYKHSKDMSEIKQTHFLYIFAYDFISEIMKREEAKNISRILIINSRETIVYDDPFTKLILNNEVQINSYPFFNENTDSSIYFNLENLNQIMRIMRSNMSVKERNLNEEEEQIRLDSDSGMLRRFVANENLVFGPMNDLLVFLDALLSTMRDIEYFIHHQKHAVCSNEKDEPAAHEEADEYYEEFNAFSKFEDNNEVMRQIEDDCGAVDWDSAQHISLRVYLNYIINFFVLSRRGISFSLIKDDNGYISFGSTSQRASTLINNTISRHDTWFNPKLVQNYCRNTEYIDNVVIKQCPQTNKNNIICK